MTSRTILKLLFDAQNRYCAGCGRRMAPWGDPDLDHNLPSIDHLWPRRGEGRCGGDHLGNMVAMHRGCNSAKGNRPPTGCELIWHQVVLVVLEIGTFDNELDRSTGATLADVWPS